MRGVLLAVVAAAVIAGCGGSDDDSGEDGANRPTATSSGGYVQRVDALCRDANPRLRRIMAALTRVRDAARSGQVGLPRTFETFGTLLRRAEVVSRRLEADLRGVVPPSEERAFHRDLLASVQKGAANLREQVSAAEARNSVRLRDLSVRGSVISAEGKGLVAGHGGFRHCGKG